MKKNGAKGDTKQDTSGKDIVKLFEGAFSHELFSSIPEPEIYAGWVVRGGVNIIYAMGGVGKTHLAIAMADYLSRQGLKAVYIDFDNPVSVVKARAIYSDDGSGLIQANPHFYYIHHSVNIPYFRENFREFYERARGIEIKAILNIIRSVLGDDVVCVIDSLQNFVDINELAQVSAFFRSLREHPFTYLIIHHMNKMQIFKGLTYIRDISDSMYFVAGVERQDGLIISHTLRADKRRFLTEEEVYIKYSGIRVKEIVNVAVSNEEEAVICRTAISILRDGPHKQSELVNKVHEKLSGRIGSKKIIKVLQDYAEKGLFAVGKSSHNALVYDVNWQSEYLSVLYELSPAKREALSLVAQLPNEFSSELRLEGSFGLQIHRSKRTLLKSIYRMSEEDMEKVLSSLRQFIESEPVSPSEPEENTEEGIDEDIGYLAEHF